MTAAFCIFTAFKKWNLVLLFKLKFSATERLKENLKLGPLIGVEGIQVSVISTNFEMKIQRCSRGFICFAGSRTEGLLERLWVRILLPQEQALQSSLVSTPSEKVFKGEEKKP